jgi:hypothetical protein
MFHARLLELETDLMLQRQNEKPLAELPADCSELIAYLERMLEVKLGSKVPHDWQGWLSYRRPGGCLVILRGRAYRENIFSNVHRAGIDYELGLQSIYEYAHGFDLVPPSSLDHLKINFSSEAKVKVLLWYGENLAEYKLIYFGEVVDDPHHDLSEAIVEGCHWIVKRPAEQTLVEFLKTLK